MTPSSHYVSYETTFPANAGPITTKIGTVPNNINGGGSMVLIDDDPATSSTMKQLLQAQFYRQKSHTLGDDEHSNGADTGPVTSSSQSTLISPMVDKNESTGGGGGGGDVVRQFCDHRRKKIRDYVNEFTRKYPVPLQCTVERSKGKLVVANFSITKYANFCSYLDKLAYIYMQKLRYSFSGTKHRMRVHFICQMRDTHCLYAADSLFAFKTKLAPIWLHLMFLQMQANSLAAAGEVLSQTSESFQTLRHCWELMPSTITRSRPFATLVTSAFPSPKVCWLLDHNPYFDYFRINSSCLKNYKQCVISIHSHTTVIRINGHVLHVTIQTECAHFCVMIQQILYSKVS
jgi:hypothetical protein